MSGWSPPEVISFNEAPSVACILIIDLIVTVPRYRMETLPLAVLVAVTQRSNLARSMDVTDCDRLRRSRLKASAMFAASLPVIYLVSLPLLGDEWGTDAVVAFSAWFAVLSAAACYFVAGISTPKSPSVTHLRTG